MIGEHNLEVAQITLEILDAVTAGDKAAYTEAQTELKRLTGCYLMRYLENGRWMCQLVTAAEEVPTGH